MSAASTHTPTTNENYAYIKDDIPITPPSDDPPIYT
jgi:hypothetical protein